MIDKDGHVKLVDFGISKQLSKGKKNTYSFCGTPAYTAPEIIQVGFLVPVFVLLVFSSSNCDNSDNIILKSIT
jgi:serine/threonine protein kinase